MTHITIDGSLGAGGGEILRLPVALKLNWREEDGSIEYVEFNGPGNVVLAELHCEHMAAMFSGFGRIGVRAEQVADSVVRSVRSWMKQRTPVGPFLADQLRLPLALSASQPPDVTVQRGGSFITGP